jgi:tryptophan synthase alpha chain
VSLESHLRERRDRGSALLVPYLTAGITADWLDYARAYVDAGADAIEIGLPFSDPMLDGPTIQQASQRALDRGITPQAAMKQLAGLDLAVPLVAMTYTNVVLRPGREEFCRRLSDCGVSGLIVVDTPHDEIEPLHQAAGRHGIELVLLVAPSTSPARVKQIGALSRGFVYAATVMGPTGERRDRDGSTLAITGSTLGIAGQVRRYTTVPVLLGFGIATPAAAVEAAAHADGIVVASALMRWVLAGSGPRQVAADVRLLRTALDADRGTPRVPYRALDGDTATRTDRSTP